MNLFELFGTISINSSVANQTIDETMEKVGELKDEMEGAEKQSDKTNKIFGKGGTLNSASVFVGNLYTKAAAVVSKVGTALVKTGFGFDASMEAYRNQFESLLGDADKAKQLVAELNTLSKVSPLGMEGLANNAVALLNAGVELTEILPTLEMLGNLSLGDTNKMNSVVRAYAQILSKGQLYAEEINQLGDAGVPFRQIMTLYGGERYADGSWYQEKLSNPKEYIIEASEMTNAFMNATAEGGKWHDYMFKMMDTWNGQVDRMGEEGKESLGTFFQPFFAVAKSDVLPKLAEGLASFGAWASENKESLSELAKSLGNIAVAGFDKTLDFLEWVTENGEAVGTALKVIATGLAIGAIAAHPYAAAIAAVAAGLAYLNSEEGKRRQRYDHFFDGYSDEELQTLQAYVDAVNAARAAEEAYTDSGFDEAFGQQWEDALAKQEQAFNAANAIEGLIADYNSWRSGQAINQGKDLYLDVPLRVADGSEAEIQSEVNGMTLEALVQLVPDTSQLSALGRIASGSYSTFKWKADGSHADGLDYVPFDNYRAILHRGEAVLTANEARDWRGGQSNGELASTVAAAVRDAVAGIQFNVSLDGGALIGQLTPTIDRHLGTLANRKGRG